MYLEKIRNIDELPLFLSVSDVSSLIGISLGKAYELFHSEDFPSIRLGKRFVIAKTAFSEWMNKPRK